MLFLYKIDVIICKRTHAKFLLLINERSRYTALLVLGRTMAHSSSLTLASPCQVPSLQSGSGPDPRPLRVVPTRYCSCGRRHLIGAISSAALLPILPAMADISFPSDPSVVMEKVHPQRPDWYEEFFAEAMQQGMRSYETEIGSYKKELFNRLPVKARRVVELGVGTGPNFKYYAGAAAAAGMGVIGVDPNKQMEKYARAAAADAGLPPMNFTFTRGVGEALPIEDNSVDAVIGTLVLCSVKDVGVALREVRRVLKPGGLYLFIEHVAAREGSLLRLMQSILDPLQQLLSDGCHLTRETGSLISEGGFSRVNFDMTILSNASLISPHIYGIACK
ncbi:methyltransferase-like protein 7A [Iris pallida]|uniref:Methyltransferase-like protein 7A n=1 Tax=Iris pallida TaxID=29817 RepID=A0AAX6F5Q6_IRIPA|nr:methyltransferase-like protein 7A [Iris pallida]